MLTVMATQALAAPAAGPEAMLKKHLGEVYGVSAKGGFEAGFLKLDDENQRLFDGIDVLNADPVCQCQDSGAHYRVAGHMDGADRYVATVRTADEPRTWQVIMRKIGPAWKFYDVIDEQGSVRARLERHNACAKAKRARRQSIDPCAELP